jgi:hypothetical protein
MDILRQANQSLRDFLARNCDSAQGSDEEVRAMLQVEQTLRAVGVKLDYLRHSDRDDVRLELGLYRDHLLRLRQQLGILQQSAAECQARLLVREKHLRAAQAWCASTRATTEGRTARFAC